MIESLIDFKNVPISKLFLNCLPDVLNSDLISVHDFFELKRFQPLTLDVEFNVPWQASYEEIILVSHTTQIQKEFLIENMVSQGYIDQDYVQNNKDHIHDEGQQMSK